MNAENRFPAHGSSTETGAVDYKARKRIEELFMLTDELLRERSYDTVRYDKKLYKKYKEVKEMNKKLQEKLFDYHCSGCQCRRSANPPAGAVQRVPSANANLDSSRKLISNVSLSSANRTVVPPRAAEATTTTTTTNQQEDLIIINEVIPRTRRPLRDDNGQLPESLQSIIRMNVRTHQPRRNYLLRVGLYPALCEFLCDRSPDSFYRRPSGLPLREFIRAHAPKASKARKSASARVPNELREIHQLYLMQFMEKPAEEDTIAARKRTYLRRTVAQKKKKSQAK